MNAIPNFFSAGNAADFNYAPDFGKLLAAATALAKSSNFTSIKDARKKVAFLGIDLQKDFCFPKGTLYVGGRSGTGAIDDNVRIAEFLYKNVGLITHTVLTMDTHFPFQIFFSTFWNDADGNPVPPFTEISVDDIASGKYVVSPVAAAACAGGNYTWARNQAKFYAEELKKAGKYTLYLWPFHCLAGSAGYALAGVIDEATAFHALVRGDQREIAFKGQNAWTECYSVFGAEVLTRWDGKALDQKNTRLIETLLTNDYVVVAGQAASHCVMSSVDDLLTDILAKDPSLAEKVYVLTDCMSAVTVPDGQGGFIADFTPNAEAAFQRYAAAGMKLVKSTDDMRNWKGIDL